MLDSRQITPRILVTTDFHPESERAFYHALAFAVAMQARLTLLHTGSEGRDAIPWERFPGVRATLATWGLLPSGAPRAAVAQSLNLGVAKMAMRDDNPRHGITDYLRKNPTDLLVTATEGRAGLARVFNPSVADSVSFLTKSHTLMLPKRSQGFIDPKTGTSSLSRVLCALDADKDPRPALAYLKQWLPVMGGERAIEIVLLHLGGAPQVPAALLPQSARLSWRQETLSAKPVDAIVSTAREIKADMVVVNTRGPVGLLARLRGCRNDQILGQIALPLLSIPEL